MVLQVNVTSSLQLLGRCSGKMVRCACSVETASNDQAAHGHRYPSDDINKFLWMVRIGGGVFPDIKEPDYLGERGYTIDDKAGKVMLASLAFH